MKVCVWALSLILVFSSACTPVRTGKQSAKMPSAGSLNAAKKANNGSALSKTAKIPSKTQRFADTTVIVMPSVTAEKNKDSKLKAEPVPEDEMGTMFDEALMLFDKENYSSACAKFKILAETLPESDSLYLEATYYLGECLIVDSKVEEAGVIFSSLLANEHISPGVLEKSIVRLGQVNCYTNKPEEAEKLFARLKKEFPESIYIAVANCDSIK